jgi:hypothetical protein
LKAEYIVLVHNPKMDSHFKVSDNNRSYRNLAKLFLDHDLYEIDLGGKYHGLESKPRKKQMEVINTAFSNGLVYLYMEDKKTRAMYRGEMMTPFILNMDSPFYLLPTVMIRAKYIQKQNTIYYTSYVLWNPNPLSPNDVAQIKNEIKNTSGSVRATIFKIRNDSL